MSCFIIILIFFTVLICRRYISLKKQLINLAEQVMQLTDGTGEKMLDTSLTAEQRRRVEIALRKSHRMKELIGIFYEVSVLDAQASV